MQFVLWKEDVNYSVSKKGRILVPGRAIDADFRRLVIDHMKSNGGYILTGYFPGSVNSVAYHFKLSRSCVAKLWNGACERTSIDPRWKGTDNPSHLHSRDLDPLEALKSAKPSMPYNKILEVINANWSSPPEHQLLQSIEQFKTDFLVGHVYGRECRTLSTKSLCSKM